MIFRALMYVYLGMYAFSNYIIRLEYKCHENVAYVAQLMLESIERRFKSVHFTVSLSN